MNWLVSESPGMHLLLGFMGIGLFALVFGSLHAVLRPPKRHVPGTPVQQDVIVRGRFSQDDSAPSPPRAPVQPKERQ